MVGFCGLLVLAGLVAPACGQAGAEQAAPARAEPRLDGVQARDRSFLGRRNGEAPRPVPADVSYRLGLLTAPPSVTDVLAWGFSTPPGPWQPLGTAPPSPAPPPGATAPRSGGFP